MRHSLSRLVTLSATLLAGSASAQSYSVIDLGTLGGASEAFAVNDLGQAVGYSQGANGLRAVIWSNGALTDLGARSPDVPARASAVNGHGVAAGEVTFGQGEHAGLFQGGVARDIGKRYGVLNSRATGINDAGQVVGYTYTWTLEPLSETPVFGFVYRDGTMEQLKAAGATWTRAAAINNQGQIAGTVLTTAGARAYVWEHGQGTDLGLVAAGASALNDQGHVVGTWTSRTGAWLYRSGQVLDIPRLPGSSWGGPESINASDQVVGSAWIDAEQNTHGYLYSNGVTTDLNALIDPSSGFFITNAHGINDDGVIAASASGRAVLLVPR